MMRWNHSFASTCSVIILFEAELLTLDHVYFLGVCDLPLKSRIVAKYHPVRVLSRVELAYLSSMPVARNTLSRVARICLDFVGMFDDWKNSVGTFALVDCHSRSTAFDVGPES